MSSIIDSLEDSLSPSVNVREHPLQQRYFTERKRECRLGYPSLMKAQLKQYFNYAKDQSTNNDKQNSTMMRKLQQQLFFNGVTNLSTHLRGDRGDKIRKSIEGNKGYVIIRNPLGPGLIPLYDELVGSSQVTQSNRYANIDVTARQVSYNQLYFINEGDKVAVDDSNLDGDILPNKTMEVIVASNEEVPVKLPLLTYFINNVVCRGISSIQPRHHVIHGSILASNESIEEHEWVPAFYHSDFPVNKHLYTPDDAKSLTVYFHLGPEPINLMMSSNSEKANNQRSEIQMELQPGDLAIWSWKQWHRTGTPIVFPTKSNFRFHLQLSANRYLLGADNGSVDIHVTEWKRFSSLFIKKKKRVNRRKRKRGKTKSSK